MERKSFNAEGRWGDTYCKTTVSTVFFKKAEIE